MKVSVARLALIAVLTVSMGQVQAYRDCLDARPSVRACPCNKPKPTAKPTSGKKAPAVEGVMMESCVRPMTRPALRPGQVDPRMKPMAMKQDMATKCPCNKPKPAKPSTTPAKANPVEQGVRAFNASTPDQQRQQLSTMVAQYVANPMPASAEMMQACTNAYCTRVKNQAMNKLVNELVSSTNKKAVQAKIVRTLQV